VDVPAHPHIGVSTLTYLFVGSLLHRDSTSAVQRVDAGEVTWMTAGRGACPDRRADRSAMRSRVQPPSCFAFSSAPRMVAEPPSLTEMWT
jgi:hypothetical protein